MVEIINEVMKTGRRGLRWRARAKRKEEAGRTFFENALRLYKGHVLRRGDGVVRGSGESPRG